MLMEPLRAVFVVVAVLLPTQARTETRVSADGPAVLEGDAGTTPLPFRIARARDTGSQVFLRFWTEDGTAREPSDYVSRTGELILPPGASGGIVDVAINGDDLPEANETLKLRIAEPVATGPYLTLGSIGRYSTGNELLDLKPNFIALGDVNLDGRRDVAVANTGTNDVGVLRNAMMPGASTTAFAAYTLVPAGFGPVGISLSDINGDGRPDLIVGNSGQVDYATSSVSVHVNTTIPGSSGITFTDPASFGGGQCGGSRLLPADFNADGKPDVAVSCSTSARVLLNGTGPGNSSAQFTLTGLADLGEYYLHAMAVADFNSDGLPDLALGNVSGRLWVFLNTTTPGSPTVSFGAPSMHLLTNGLSTVSAGDLNGDGRPDLVVARSQLQNDPIPPRVEVLFNLTAPGATVPSFAPFVPFNVASKSPNASLADINGDGRLDIVVAMSGNPISFESRLNATEPGALTPDFRGGGSVVINGWMIAHAAGDLNNDGRPDFALVEYGEAYQNLHVVLNATPLAGDSPDFRAAAGFASGSQPAAAAIADFNLDGRQDLAAANAADGTISVLAGQTDAGSIIPAFAAAVPVAVGTQPAALLAVDLNSDGKPDLASGNAGGNSVSVLMNTGAPGAAPAFGETASMAVGSVPRGLAAGDFNGDGKVDVAVANSGSNTVSVLFNGTAPGSASAVFSSAGSPATGTAPRGVTVADFNLDGKLDLATADAGDNTATVLLSTTAPGASSASFAAGSALAMGAKPVAIAAADLNLDGRADLVTADETDGTVSVRFNTTAPGAASASFSSRSAWPVGAAPSAVALRDLDGDGKPEILVTDAASDTVRVLRNNTAPGAASPRVASVGDFVVGDSPAGLAAADLNGDGQLDLVVADAGDGSLSVLLNTLFTVTLENDTGIGTILDDDTDAVPDAFSFPTQTGVAAGAVVVSAPVTVSGINVPASISVTGGEYSLDGGAFTSTSATVSNGQSVRVRHTAAVTVNTATNTTLTIGGVEGTFTSVTANDGGPDTTPDAFSFARQTGVAPGSAVVSNAITVSGINAPAAISVTGGEYSIDGGAFTAAAGTVTNGQSVRVRHVAATTPLTETVTPLTIGGVSAAFTSTTADRKSGGGAWNGASLLALLLAALRRRGGPRALRRSGVEEPSPHARVPRARALP